MTEPGRTPRQVPLAPPQHGAWAFLGLPLVVGICTAAWTPVLLLLAVAWIAAYPWSYFVLAIVKERSARHPRPERFRRALGVWSVIAVPALLALVIARPWLVWPGLLYAIAFGINAAFAFRRDERDLVNDAVLIAECALLVPIAWGIGASGRSLVPPALAAVPVHVWILTIAVTLLLVGSTLHVRSFIRERTNASFARLSQAFAILSLVFALLLAWWWPLPAGLWLVPAFAFAVARSFAMTGRTVAPVRIGMIELIGFVLLAIGAAAIGQS